MRRVSLGLLIIGLCLFPFACGAPSDEAAPQESSVSPAAPRAVTLSLMTIQLQPDFNDYMEGVIAAFEAENPGIEVEWSDFPIDGYLNKLQTLFFNNEAPDVINLTHDLGVQVVQQGVLQNLAAIDGAEEVIAGYFPRVIETACTWEGETYALPWYLATDVTMINTALLAEAGMEDEPYPRTWLELMSRSAELKLALPNRFGFFYPLTDDARFRRILGAEGISLVVDLAGGGMRAGFDTPAAAEVLERWQSAYEAGLMPRDSLTELHPRGIELFKTGQIAFFISGPQFLRILEEDAPDIFAVTDVSPGILGAAEIHYVDVMNLTLPDRGDTPEAQERERLAFALAAFITNAQNQLAFCRRATIFPSVAAAIEDPYFQQDDGTLEGKARVIAAAQLASAEVYVPALPEAGRLNDAMNRAVERTLLGQTDAEAALAQAAETWNEILAGN